MDPSRFSPRTHSIDGSNMEDDIATGSVRDKLAMFGKPATQVDFLPSIFVHKKEKQEPPKGPEVQSQEYLMDHSRRGKALIFNHSSFSDPKKFRRGARVDGDNVSQCFANLGFQVDMCEDYNKSEIYRKLENVSREDHGDADCLVIVAMTHGQPGQLHAYDDSYKETVLWKNFTADKCPSLAGKPKLFFIQACRGDQSDSGAEIMSRAVTMTDGPSGPKMSYVIPTTADILVAHATYEGQYAWRDVEAGSWFIQALCAEFKENGNQYDILRIMTNVNRRVATQFVSRSNKESMNRKKQMPNFFSTLTRLLYFKPKPKAVKF